MGLLHVVIKGGFLSQDPNLNCNTVKMEEIEFTDNIVDGCNTFIYKPEYGQYAVIAYKSPLNDPMLFHNPDILKHITEGKVYHYIPDQILTYRSESGSYSGLDKLNNWLRISCLAGLPLLNIECLELTYKEGLKRNNLTYWMDLLPMVPTQDDPDLQKFYERLVSLQPPI